MWDTYKMNERIRTLRLERGFTQQELGDLLGITAQAVSKWETGLATPDITLLPKLSELFNCSIDSLYYGFETRIGLEVTSPSYTYRVSAGQQCSFCGKHPEQAWRIIAGPGVRICSECVEICGDILKQIKQVDGTGS
ncbi:helix-turn-helix domain-containing protein [Paenibacillus spongiae]|uniref:Helix-turn-helix domain-containing protein n=1 Tax=Paenibacillus spongiae TaxID=2909671 RepID=A0ABY5S7J4_9BACL|nr:helix-turn-helix domain-containing protein [Paenibacillus spongiae]UVI28765.1 helix-turn-helix domain-containing protein [Paenibacillus spongiae]